jgi:hypothetical protein
MVKDGKQRRSTGERWENYYPAIVPPTLFAAAQAAAERRRILPNRRDCGYHNVFQGLLRCGHCGATLARKRKAGAKTEKSRNSPGYALFACVDRERDLTECPNWNARELETRLLPPLIQCVSAEVLEGNVKKHALVALEAQRAAHSQDKKAVANLLAIVERVGASDALAGRIRHLETALAERQARIASLSATANDPVSAVWEEDVDEAIAKALRAVRDITDEHMHERAELHQSLTRVISAIYVWPNSHAAVKLRDDDLCILLPLSDSLGVAAIAGLPQSPPNGWAAEEIVGLPLAA